MLASPIFLRGSAPRCTPWTSSTAFLQPIFLCRLGKSTCRRLRFPIRSHHGARPAAVGCVSRSRSAMDELTPFDAIRRHSINTQPNRPSRSRTHQNQSLGGDNAASFSTLPIAERRRRKNFLSRLIRSLTASKGIDIIASSFSSRSDRRGS
jgi:hypothetical protein